PYHFGKSDRAWPWRPQSPCRRPFDTTRAPWRSPASRQNPFRKIGRGCPSKPHRHGLPLSGTAQKPLSSYWCPFRRLKPYRSSLRLQVCDLLVLSALLLLLSALPPLLSVLPPLFSAFPLPDVTYQRANRAILRARRKCSQARKQYF